MVIILFVVTTIKSLLMQHYYHSCFKTGMFLKSTVTGIVYRKVSRLIILNDIRIRWFCYAIYSIYFIYILFFFFFNIILEFEVK